MFELFSEINITLQCLRKPNYFTKRHRKRYGVFAYVHNETEAASTQLVNITGACNFLEFSIDITFTLTQHFYRTWWK